MNFTSKNAIFFLQICGSMINLRTIEKPQGLNVVDLKVFAKKKSRYTLLYFEILPK